MRLLLGLLLVAAAACSAEDGPTDDAAPTTTSTAVVDVSTAPTTTTTQPERTSSAVITIGPASYELDAICASGGAGEVEVSLSGADVNGLRVVGYVRAFLGEPYASIQVGQGEEAVLFEPRLEGGLLFELTEAGVSFPEVDFVTDLDLESGEFTPAGRGTVDVTCDAYERELPPIPFE